MGNDLCSGAAVWFLRAGISDSATPRGARGYGRAFGRDFFRWYNHEHRHSGLGFLTPVVVHYGVAAAVREQRQHVLAVAYAAHPERFVKGRPHPADLPQAVWINPPAKKSTAQDGPGSTIVTSHDLRVDRIADVVGRTGSLSTGSDAPLITAPSVSQCH
jgi:hypothetical protein